MEITQITRKQIGEYILKSASGNNETVDVDGGYLVSRSIINEIIDTLKYQSVLFNKARKLNIPTGQGNGIKVPYSITDLTNEPSTGTRAYWVSEAAQKTISKPQLAQADLQFGKLVVRVPVTEDRKSVV